MERLPTEVALSEPSRKFKSCFADIVSRTLRYGKRMSDVSLRNIQSLLSGLLRPVPEEMRKLLMARWRSLPVALQTEKQMLGRSLVHCGFTLGAAYCSFGCTHCYLPRNANRVPLPTLTDMYEQIRANRRLNGPGAGLQITGGDVVDAYCRAGRKDELIEIVRYANALGSVPILMTHGQQLLDDPDYLMRLVREGGLRKLGLHIDMTQAGRPEFPIRALNSETDLHPLREAFVRLVCDVRRVTGVSLSAALLVTVTQRNIASVPDIMRWLTGDPDRLGVFHTVSFQTEADVGRTRMSSSPVTPAQVWRQIGAGIAQTLPREGLIYGHPACTSLTILLVLFPQRRVFNLVTDDQTSHAFWSALTQLFGGIGVSGQKPCLAWGKKLGVVIRNPWRTVQLLLTLRRLLHREGIGPQVWWALLLGRARGLNLVMHNFMSANELAQPRDELVDERLAACSFRGAVRRDGEWIAEPMCTINAAHRGPLYAQQIATAAGSGISKAAPARSSSAVR